MKKLLVSLMASVMLVFSTGVAVSQASTVSTNAVTASTSATTVSTNSSTGEDTASTVVAKDNTKEIKKAKVSKNDKVFLGVCGGLGEYFGIDSDLIRVGFVFLSLAFGLGLVTYLICYAVMAN